MTRHTFFCIDGHTAGNPVRLVAGGAPPLKGATMAEKRQDLIARFDWIRTGLCFEPRGHDMMSGGFLYPPAGDDADCGLVFIETSGCLPMCGHGTIGMVTFALEHGLVAPRTPGRLTIEVPAGTIGIDYEQAGDKVEWVRIRNVPSYLAASGLAVDVPGLGPLVVDIAYGGNFYAIVEPQAGYAGLDSLGAARIVEASRALQDAGPRRVRAGPSARSEYSRRQPRALGRRSERRGRRRPQRGLLRRAGDRPESVRHRHLGPPGPARRDRAARGRRQLRPRILYRQPLHRPDRGGGERRRHRPAIIPSIQGSAVATGLNTIWIDTDDPFHAGFTVT